MINYLNPQFNYLKLIKRFNLIVLWSFIMDFLKFYFFLKYYRHIINKQLMLLYYKQKNMHQYIVYKHLKLQILYSKIKVPKLVYS